MYWHHATPDHTGSRQNSLLDHPNGGLINEKHEFLMKNFFVAFAAEMRADSILMALLTSTALPDLSMLG